MLKLRPLGTDTVPVQSGRTMLEAMGWAMLLPQMLATLGTIFQVAGVGTQVGRLTTSVLPKDARPLVTKVDAGTPASDGRVVSLSASGPDEITGAAAAEGHGLFTYYLLNGLNGGAVGEDGRVTVRGLYE